MSGNPGTVPSWAKWGRAGNGGEAGGDGQLGDDGNPHLHHLLNYALTNYGRHHSCPN